MKLRFAILMALAVSSHAHVASLGAGGAVLGGLGLVHLGLKGAALAGVKAGLSTAAKLGVLGAGIAVTSRLKRGHLHGGEPGLVTYGGIDSITTSDWGNGGYGGSEGWSSGVDGFGGEGIGSSGFGGEGNGGSGLGGAGFGGSEIGNSGIGGAGFGGSEIGNFRIGGRSAGTGGEGGNGLSAGDGLGNYGWNDYSGSSLGGYNIVGPPKGAPHITLIQGKASHGGDFGGSDGNRRNDIGNYKHEKKASYVAVTRGAIHEAPLVGHIASVKSANFQPAPGTTW